MTPDVAEVIPSPDGKHRALILRRPDGLVQVEIERYFKGDGVYEPPHWDRVSETVIIADTVDRARLLAHEEMERFRS
jgi:hypothetical protein